jgi:CRISPR system Cascade subunit CasA
VAEFNLIDEKWIPCITLDGSSGEFGIRDTLLKAHELREICDDSPLVTVAMHRLLLAVLYRACQWPSDMRQWKALYAYGSFCGNKSITNYLEEWKDYFFLFHDDHPFMQIAKLDLNEYKNDGAIKKDKSDGLMRLVREAPDKGGRVLFDHRTGTEKPEYESSAIVRMLLACQSYAGTGIPLAGQIGEALINPYKPFKDNPDKKSACEFAPCVDGLCLWLQGENLFQTLMINLVPIALSPTDLPAWEDSSITKSAMNSWKKPIAFAGPIQRLAPLSRCIRVLDRRSMFFTNGLKTTADADDSMKAYLRAKDTDQFTPIKLRKDKAAWRDAHTLFSLTSTTRKPPASLNHVARLFRDGTLPKSAQPRANQRTTPRRSL